MNSEDYAKLIRLADRDLIGPGVWFSLHMMAYHAQSSPVMRDALIEYVQVLREKFPCEECRQHFNQLTDRLSPTAFENEEYGHFKWSYIAHKTVNERLGKETPSFEAAFRFFTDPKNDCKNCSLTKKKRGFAN